MKVKLFEEYDINKLDDHFNPNYWAFEDKKLKIQKILHGANKGKIIFRFFNKQTDSYDKYSMMLGSTIILDTKYNKKTEIREITLGPKQFRKVYSKTINSIIELFCDDQKLIPDIKLKFSKKLEEIPENCNDLGDIMDALKIIRYEIKLITEPKKYNL